MDMLTIVALISFVVVVASWAIVPVKKLHNTSSSEEAAA